MTRTGRAAIGLGVLACGVLVWGMGSRDGLTRVADAQALMALIAPPALPVCIVGASGSLGREMNAAGMDPIAAEVPAAQTLILLREPDGGLTKLRFGTEVSGAEAQGCDIAGLRIAAIDVPDAPQGTGRIRLVPAP